MQQRKAARPSSRMNGWLVECRRTTHPPRASQDREWGRDSGYGGSRDGSVRCNRTALRLPDSWPKCASSPTKISKRAAVASYESGEDRLFVLLAAAPPQAWSCRADPAGKRSIGDRFGARTRGPKDGRESVPDPRKSLSSPRSCQWPGSSQDRKTPDKSASYTRGQMLQPP